MKYGQRLRAARKHKKLTQDELAELSGVKQGSISKIERGDQDRSTFDIDLAISLDVSPKWLKDGDPTHSPAWISTKNRKQAVTEIVTRKIKALGGDAMTIRGCVQIANTLLDNNHSACRAIESAVDAGTRIVDGGIQNA